MPKYYAEYESPTKVSCDMKAATVAKPGGGMTLKIGVFRDAADAFLLGELHTWMQACISSTSSKFEVAAAVSDSFSVVQARLCYCSF